MSLTGLPKNKTPTKAYEKRFKEVVENNYKGWNHIYTDGSKSEIGVGDAASTGSHTESASLSKFSSIFTEETYAIQLALNTISPTKGKNFSEKLPTSASKANADQPKSTKTETHHCEPTEIRKNSGTLLDTWTRRYSRKQNRR